MGFRSLDREIVAETIAWAHSGTKISALGRPNDSTNEGSSFNRSGRV